MVASRSAQTYRQGRDTLSGPHVHLMFRCGGNGGNTGSYGICDQTHSCCQAVDEST